MSDKPSTFQSYAFVDSSTNIEDLKKIIQENDFLVITFDIESHQKLNNNNINHILSDNFLNDDELDHIQTKCYSFAKWAECSNINPLFQYEGFNLGNFFYQEVFIFLIPFLKKLMELKKIIQKYFNGVFYSSGILKQIVELLDFSCNTITEQKFELNIFQNDHINLQNNFFGLKISRKNYLEFKQLMEKIISIFLKPNDISTNNILISEFNTTKYGSLFKKLSENNLNPIFYGRKRPAIWNLNSFSIIKNSKTSIITKNELNNEKITNKIFTDRIKITSQIIEIFEKNDFFIEYFSIDNTSFWKIIKPFIFELSKRRINEAIEEINLVKSLLEKTKPKCILVLSESSYTDQFLISQAKTIKIPVILLQHGIGGSDGPESNIINEFTGSMPILSNKFLVWGNAAETYAKQFGVSEKNIHRLGSSTHDKLFTNLKKNITLKNDFILITAGSATTNHIKDYSISTHEEYEHTLKEICKSILKTKKKIIIKMHPYVDGKIERDIVKKIDPTIQVITKGNISSLIESCELMITLAVTSATLDAQILEKPVIRLPLKEWWGPPDTYRTSPGLTVQVEEFEVVFNKILNDSIFRQQVIDNGKIFVNDCLVNQGSSAKSIAEFLKNSK
jgi:hypothetical protein